MSYIPPPGSDVPLHFSLTYIAPNASDVPLHFPGEDDWSGTGTAAGTSNVAGVGKAGAKAVGSAAGTCTVSGVGAFTFIHHVGTAAGVASVSGVGSSKQAATGTAAGTSSVSGVGRSKVAAVGTAAGTSTVIGVGRVGAVGSAAGTSSVVGVGGARRGAVGLAAGTCNVVGVGTSFTTTVLRAHKQRVIETVTRRPPRAVEELQTLVGCSRISAQAVAGIGHAGCAVAGIDLGARPAQVAKRTIERLSSPRRAVEDMSNEFGRRHPGVTGCTPTTRQGLAGVGKAGCAVAGRLIGDSETFVADNGNAKRIIEGMRRPSIRVVEQTLDQYSRMHPIIQGCSNVTRQAVAGIGNAGCAVAGHDSGYR